MAFENLKNMRGLLYRKILERAKVSSDTKDTQAKQAAERLNLPGFSIKTSVKMIDFPKFDDISKVNITYPLVDPFAYANIKWVADKKELNYFVVEPEMSEDEWKIFKDISNALIELVDVGMGGVRDKSKAIDYLQTQVKKVIEDLGMTIDYNTYVKMMYYIYRNFIGYNEIDGLLQDPNIEDISGDGVDSPVYVIHRKFGSLKTNVIFKNSDDLREFVVKLAERCGRYVSYAEPILDGTLPDGSRVSATVAGDVATRGPTFTIRKFSEKPFSPIELIEMKTADSELFAYFWYLLEHGASMLIVGGVATGKTSFLNSISMFIPPEAKIVSIEDTREIRIPHQHWVAGLARSGFGIPLPTGEKYGEITLFDLLKESFRQNPDYVIVGEVRGSEAYVMFQGMSSGHPSISTFHAGTVETVIKRLTTPPIGLSATLIESLDVVVVMIHAKEKGKSARRIREIVEIISVDPRTDEVKTNVVYRWDPVTDTYEKVNESMKLEKFATAKGSTFQEAEVEVERRRKILEWMGRKGTKEYMEFSQYVNTYYKEPEKILELIGETYIPKKIPIQIPTERKAGIIENTVTSKPKTEEKLRPKSVLGILGFKMKPK